MRLELTAQGSALQCSEPSVIPLGKRWLVQDPSEYNNMLRFGLTNQPNSIGNFLNRKTRLGAVRSCKPSVISRHGEVGKY